MSRRIAVQGIRFITYHFIEGDGPVVDWSQSLPDYLDRYETILAAGYEPEDSTVKVGTLNYPWYEHPKGCMLVSYA